MVDIIGTNWPVIVAAGGAVWWIVSIYNKFLEIRLNQDKLKQNRLEFANLSEEEKKRSEEIFQDHKRQIRDIKQYVKTITIIIFSLMAVSIYSFIEKKMLRSELANIETELSPYRKFKLDLEKSPELDEKWSLLQQAQYRTDSLKAEIIEYGQIYSDAYDFYLDGYEHNLNLRLAIDSAEYNIMVLKWSTEKTQEAIVLLSRHADSLLLMSAKLETTIEEVDKENINLSGIYDELRLEAGLLQVYTPSLDWEPLAGVNGSMFVDVGRYKVGNYSTALEQVRLDAGERLIKIAQPESPELDTSIMMIQKSENELLSLVEIDLLLIGRFNERLNIYYEDLKDRHNELENKNNELEDLNIVLTDSLAATNQRMKLRSKKYKRTEGELEFQQKAIDMLTSEYENLVGQYNTKINHQIALLEDIRELQLGKLKQQVENR